MGNEWDINMQTVIIVETELIVRNLPQHYGDERIKWFAHSRVGSPRILNQLRVFVDIKTRIGCPRPPLRTPSHWMRPSNQWPGLETLNQQGIPRLPSCSSSPLMTSGQRGARVWRTSHLLPRDASLFNTSSIFQVLRASSDRWDNSPPRLGEYEELILHTGRVNDGQIKTCFPRPLCLDKRPYVTCPTCLGVMRGHLGY